MRLPMICLFAVLAVQPPTARAGIADLDLDGASHLRYPPLRVAIAAHYGVTVEQVVAAAGCSMANFLAMVTLIAPGDEVLVERPAYEPLLPPRSWART